MLKKVLITLMILLAFVIGWHILVPLLGATIAVGAATLLLASGFITALCAAILLTFIFSGIGLIILTVFGIAITMSALAFFPVLFPLLLPLLIILLFVSKNNEKKKSKSIESR